MYRILIFLLFSTSFSFSVLSQVTIGSPIPPASGALLDLKQTDGLENSTKGIVMPRVKLVGVDKLEPCATTNTTNKELYIGLTAYNLSETIGLSKGVYTWDGNVWKALVLGPWNNVETKTAAYDNNKAAYIMAPIAIGKDVIAADTELDVLGRSELNGNVKIVGTDPNNTLESSLNIEGTLRLKTKEDGKYDNETKTITQDYRNVLIDIKNGRISYTPKSLKQTIGTSVPTETVTTHVIKTFPTSNTMARVRFVCYVKNASKADIIRSYTFGSFDIIGTGTENPIKFISTIINDNEGNSKQYATISPTSIYFPNGTLQPTTISLNQTTGELTIACGRTFVYVFDIIGGI